MLNPYKKFNNWFNLVEKKKLQDPTVFSLATVDLNNQPHVRMVLLKKVLKDGFVFFTNLKSNKGKQFLKNNKLSMCFYWESINRQIRIVGKGKVIPESESDNYFQTRIRGSQIGAWASLQSSEIKSKIELKKKIKLLENKYKKKSIPRPKYWVGIKILPSEFEFWKQGKYRIHDRELFSLKNKEWESILLSP